MMAAGQRWHRAAGCGVALAMVCMVAMCIPASSSPLDDPMTPPYNGSWVKDLSGDSFDADLQEAGDLVLVQFWAPWCTHCRVMKAEMELAGGLVFEHGIDVAIARVNVDDYPIAEERFGFTRMPTYKLFSTDAEEVQDFPAYPNGEAIVSALHSLTSQPGTAPLSPAKMFFDVDTLSPWLFWRGGPGGKLRPSAVLFVPSRESLEEEGDFEEDEEAAEEAMVEAFDNLARKRILDLRFVNVVSDNVLKTFKLPLNKPSLVLYVDHDEGRFVYDGPPKVDAMDAWLMARLVPLVTTVDHYNLKSITKRGKLLVHIFVREAEVENPRAASAIKSQLARVGATLEAEGLVQRGDLTLALTNGEKYSDWMNVFGLEGAELPAVGANDLEAESVFASQDPIGIAVGADSSAATLESDQAALRESGVLPDGTQGTPVLVNWEINQALLADFVRSIVLKIARPYKTDVHM